MQPKPSPRLRELLELGLLTHLVRRGDAEAVAYVVDMMACSKNREDAAHKLGITLRTLERLRDDVPDVAAARTLSLRSSNLSHDVAVQIRKAGADVSREELAKQFGISVRTVSRARAGFPKKKPRRR